MDISTYYFNIFDDSSYREKIEIKDLLEESNRDEFKINFSLDDGEREKFNQNLKDCLKIIFENIFNLNLRNEIIFRADSYEKVFFDILELIVVNKFDFESESYRLSYYPYNKLKFVVLISLQYREQDNLLEFNFILTIELTMYYYSNKIECDIKYIDIQYKITEDCNLKLNSNLSSQVFISKKGAKKTFKELNARKYLNNYNKLKYVSLIKNERIDEFHLGIRKILIEKGIENKENKLYSNGLFRVFKFNEIQSNKLIKCKNCNLDQHEAVKIFFIENSHKCKFFLCMNCFSIKRNLRILNDDCLNCGEFLVNYFLMKNIINKLQY